MGFLGLNGVLLMGSMWFAEVQSGSQGFFEVHLGSMRFDGAFGVKWDSMGSIWFVEVLCGLKGFFEVKWSSMGSMWFAEVQCGSQGFFEVQLGSVIFNVVRCFFGWLNGVLWVSMGFCGVLGVFFK